MRKDTFDFISMGLWFATTVGTWATYFLLHKVERARLDERAQGYREGYEAAKKGHDK